MDTIEGTNKSGNDSVVIWGDFGTRRRRNPPPLQAPTQVRLEPSSYADIPRLPRYTVTPAFCIVRINPFFRMIAEARAIQAGLLHEDLLFTALLEARSQRKPRFMVKRTRG